MQTSQSGGCEGESSDERHSVFCNNNNAAAVRQSITTWPSGEKPDSQGSFLRPTENKRTELEFSWFFPAPELGLNIINQLFPVGLPAGQSPRPAQADPPLCTEGRTGRFSGFPIPALRVTSPLPSGSCRTQVRTHDQARRAKCAHARMQRSDPFAEPDAASCATGLRTTFPITARSAPASACAVL